MRITRPRITVSRLMVVVALAAMTIGGAVEVERQRRWSAASAVFRQKAAYAERRRQTALQRIENNKAQITENARQVRINKDYPRSVASMKQFTDECLAQIDRERRIAEHCGRLRAKYERAARDPFSPVEPDPPEPR